MSSLSNPNPYRADDPLRIINFKKYENEKVLGNFILDGEDAFWLKKLAHEQGYTEAALVKELVIEGLYRRRSYLNIGEHAPGIF